MVSNSFPITSSSSSLGGLELGCCKIEEDKECDTIGQTLPSSLSFVNIVASDPKRNESNISISQNSLITPSKITGSTDSVITIVIVTTAHIASNSLAEIIS